MTRLWPVDGRRRPGLALWLGRRAYRPLWQLQRRLAEARRQQLVPDLVLLVEHPPTYTLGRAGRLEHLLVDEAGLARLGAELVAIDRGGDITFHGPGQLIGYPIIDLLTRERDIHRYLRLLEEAIIQLLAKLGLTAGRLPPHTGVWLDGAKVAAIGVKVSRGITFHGFALNLTTDLRFFEAIVPCGIHDRGVTSLARRLLQPPSLAEAGALVADRLADLAGLDLTWHALSQVTTEELPAAIERLARPLADGPSTGATGLS
jgi:lipoate-protein ligase B